MKYFVYILQCQNDALYIGYTNNLLRRYREHCLGSVKCKFTRSFPPKEMVAMWAFDSGREARQYEAKLKRLSRSEKLALIESNFTALPVDS